MTIAWQGAGERTGRRGRRGWVLALAALIGYLAGGPAWAGEAPAPRAEEPKKAETAAPAAPKAEEEEEEKEAAPGKKEVVTGEEEVAAPAKQMTWLDNLLAAGWIGGVQVLLSIVMVALIIDNMLKIRRDVMLPPALLEQFEARLKSQQYPEAYQLARQDPSLTGRALAAGLSKLAPPAGSYAKAMEAMQGINDEEGFRLEQRLSYLAMIGTLAPMLGLLGTVLGMVQSFNVIAASTQQPKPSQLAGGISMALMTTVIGLIVAIPAIAFFGFLRNRASRLLLEIGMVTEQMMSRFSGVTGGQKG